MRETLIHRPSPSQMRQKTRPSERRTKRATKTSSARSSSAPSSPSADERVAFPAPVSEETLSWAEVNRTHRIRNGVYQRDGLLISLLTDFGRINPCYPDEPASLDGETIIYTGEGRRGDQSLTRGNRALLDAIETGRPVPLFNKLGVGRWQSLGFWRVTAAEHRYDEAERRMLWRFTLRRDARRSGEERKSAGSSHSLRSPRRRVKKS